MIQRLSVRNYAIIDHLELELGDGFNVFTGETGAGKSIVIGALGLLLGDKGDTTMIRTGEDKAVVEGEFAVRDKTARARVKEILFDDPETVIIRRELSHGGKGRIFINGLQEPLSKLEALGEWLVDVHGQHDHQLLLNQKVHLDILDSYGSLKPDREKVGQIFQRLTAKTRELGELEQDEKKLSEEKTYWETAVQDIENAGFSPQEEDELSLSLRKMENAEKIYAAFSEAHDLLYADERSVSVKLLKSAQLLREHAPVDRRYEELCEILDDASAKVDESAKLLADYREELDFDSKTMEETIDRLEFIKDLKRKYRKNSVEELLQYARDCRDRLSKFANRTEEVRLLKEEILALKDGLVRESLALSQKRQDTGRELALKIRSELSYLGMEKAEVAADVKYVKDEDSPIRINDIPIRVSETGIDRVEFLISSNAGEELKPLKKVASGGEISRVMLALKSIFAAADSIETLIFDEIDVGIGGLTANNVGVKLNALAAGRQIVVITHLPQIASRARNHFLISKWTDQGKTFTKVGRISGRERVEEIARMLGGDSEKAREHAKEMLAASGAAAV